jgi:hypothetical protein
MSKKDNNSVECGTAKSKGMEGLTEGDLWLARGAAPTSGAPQTGRIVLEGYY